MRYTPSLPPLAEVPESTTLKGLQHAQPVRPVKERLFPAKIAEHYPHRESATEQAQPLETEEKRTAEERRLCCRRITPEEVLLETRSDIERRRKNRRSGDTATAVDDEV